jgi:hypothetical protein
MFRAPITTTDHAAMLEVHSERSAGHSCAGVWLIAIAVTSKDQAEAERLPNLQHLLASLYGA